MASNTAERLRFWGGLFHKETASERAVKQAREEVFGKAGNRGPQELNKLLDGVQSVLKQERERGGSLLPTIPETQAAYAGKEALREGEVLFVPQAQGEVLSIGDLHGDFAALEHVITKAHFFEKMQEPGRPIKIIFSGDFLERGRKSAEIAEALFALKTMFPDNIYLIPGNHDLKYPLAPIAKHLEQKVYAQEPTLQHEMYVTHNKYADIFDSLPRVIALGNGMIYTHGGPDLQGRNLQQLARISTKGKRVYTFDKVMTWSDLGEPIDTDRAAREEALSWLQKLVASKEGVSFGTKEYSVARVKNALRLLSANDEVYPNTSKHRGGRHPLEAALRGTMLFTPRAADKFLDTVGATYFVRGHQMSKVGVTGRIITLHTTGQRSPDAADEMTKVKVPNYAIFPLDRRVTSIAPDAVKPVWKHPRLRRSS